MTTKTIVQMIAEMPPDRPDNSPSADMLRLESKVALLRAALEKARPKAHAVGCAFWLSVGPCTCGYDDSNKVLEVTRG
jgi:hypothetical protein